MSRRILRVAFVLGVVVLAACSDDPSGTCEGANCACTAEQTDCAGVCVDTQTDAANCGACGNACAAGEVCTDGGCQVPCDASRLTGAIADPWGNVWDGAERTAAPLDAAAIECAGFGARLPSATELHRVNATRPTTIAQTFNTNFLWTRIANDRVNQATVRLSDGATSTTAALTPTPYRCVCPAARPRGFAGTRCNGAPGSECFRHGSYNIDREDRAPLRKSAAIRECVIEKAHLAELEQLAGAAEAGLPGSNNFITVADGSRYDLTTTMKWAVPGWDVPGNHSTASLTSAMPFRCAGTATAATASTTPVPMPFVPTSSAYKSDAVDQPVTTWAAAHDMCWQRGGHLPRSAELAELITEGLPGGSSTLIWTADQLGYNGTQFLAATLRWPGVDRRFPLEYTGGVDDSATWNYKTASHAFRCIYYPIDPAFVPPATCNGGCNVRSAGSPAVTIFFDQMDRAAATIGAAIRDCAASGGHLASERDLTEAIRGGLPNGTGTYLNTWDLGIGSNPTALATIVLWSGTQTAFDDQYPAYMTWSDPAAARPYRCMWTNELR